MTLDNVQPITRVIATGFDLSQPPPVFPIELGQRRAAGEYFRTGRSLPVVFSGAVTCRVKHSIYFYTSVQARKLMAATVW